MTTPTPVRTMTAEEFQQTTDPENMRSELILGEVVYMPPANTIHGRRGLLIGRALEDFCEPRRLGLATGEGGYILTRDPDTVRAPDAAFLSSDRIPPAGIPERGYFEGAPNLAVEVISPDDRDFEIALKVTLWLDAGAERVWEVRPRTRTVTVHSRGSLPLTLGINETLVSAHAAFPVDGFSLPIASIFA